MGNYQINPRVQTYHRPGTAAVDRKPDRGAVVSEAAEVSRAGWGGGGGHVERDLLVRDMVLEHLADLRLELPREQPVDVREVVVDVYMRERGRPWGKHELVSPPAVRPGCTGGRWAEHGGRCQCHGSGARANAGERCGFRVNSASRSLQFFLVK